MSIFLIEDIDCAFPSREDEENNAPSPYPIPGVPYPMGRRSAVTLSGLLNVIDGIGSEEGKLFFATVIPLLYPSIRLPSINLLTVRATDKLR
jgi:chaperone BCS1